MLGLIFSIVILHLEVMGRHEKHNWRIDTRIDYVPGVVCNYEPYYLSNLNFVLYTCVHESRCRKAGEYARSLRKPELDIDNCNFTFHHPVFGGKFVCCHPQDNLLLKDNPNGTIGPITRFMPGFRSAFKCKDYSSLVCFGKKFCPETMDRRERKGGTETEIARFPHLAAVGWYNEENNYQSWFCLGSIISERFILTAASCRENIDTYPANYVRVGDTELCMLGVNCPPTKTAQRIPIEKKIHHPANLLAWYYHDIMLLKLKRNITFNVYVRPACLITDMEFYTGGAPYQAGGVFAFYETRPEDGKNTTHEYEIEIYSTEICNRWYFFDIRTVDPGIDPDIMFCAGLGHVDKVPCTGDFGGPLQTQDDVPYCMWQIYGVFAYSQTFFCRGNKNPIFTRVPYYLAWIDDVVWHDFNLFTEFDTCSGQCKEALAQVEQVPDGRCRA